eukprot:1260280-Pleurochrysis_carterae.AAC.5
MDADALDSVAARQFLRDVSRAEPGTARRCTGPKANLCEQASRLRRAKRVCGSTACTVRYATPALVQFWEALSSVRDAMRPLAG